VRLPAGACIFNGGDRGEIALVLSGLGAFSFQDTRRRNHIFSLVPAGRLMGNVDDLTADTVSVTDMALRETEVRLVQRETFLAFLDSNPEIERSHALGVIADHESDMEGMIANFTLSARERIAALFSSLVHNLAPEADARGRYPLPFALTAVEISQIVAVARPTVSSILSDLSGPGLLVRRDHRHIVSARLFDILHDRTSRGAGPAARIVRRHRRAPSQSAEQVSLKNQKCQLSDTRTPAFFAGL
jgi:putative cyclic nucleotide-binding domain protein